MIILRNNKEYSQYLLSPHWKHIKMRTRYLSGGFCWVCKEPLGYDSICHHRTYERLGAEKVGDVEMVCSTCHNGTYRYELHKEGGLIGLLSFLPDYAKNLNKKYYE